MSDGVNNNFKLKRKYSNYNRLIQFVFVIIIIFFVFCISITEERHKNLISFSSEINLVIIGKGNQNLIFSDFTPQPSQVFVEGNLRDSCTISCELENEESNVKLIFDGIIRYTQAMFYTLDNLKEIDLSNFDFSNVISMKFMFQMCINLEKVEFGNIITSNVVNMAQLFYECNKLESVDVSKFDTSKVTDMQGMFYNCFSLSTIDLSNFITSNVENIRIFLYNCYSLNSIDVSKFDTSKVANMEGMFYNCSSLKSIDLSNFNTSNVENLRIFLYNCYGLNSIDISSKFDTSNVNTMEAMFYNCSSLKSIDLSNFNTQKVNTFRLMFYNCIELISIDVSNFDTSNVISMHLMFYNCSSLLSIDVSHFNTKNVESIYGLFYNCNKLTTLDVSNFDTSKVTDIEFLFYNLTNLESIDISNFNITKIESLKAMFYNCEKLTTIDISSLDTSKIKDFSFFFYGCSSLKSLDLSRMDTSSAIIMDALFYNCNNLESLDLSIIDTSSVTSMRHMFFGCHSLKSMKFLEKFNTSNVESMYAMFTDCKSLTSLNLFSFDTTKVKEMSLMFQNCYNLKYLDISHFSPSNLEKIVRMFYNMVSLRFLNIYSLDITTQTLVDNSFENLSSKLKICSNKINMQNYLLSINKNYDCDDICFQKNANIAECLARCDYYFYFNESNARVCTESENCTGIYNKLIPEKSQCIDKCDKDDTYKYEYINTCYEECPEETIKSSKKNYTCLGEENIFQNDLGDNEDIHQIISTSILNKYDTSNGEEMVFPGEDNFFFHITNTENELELLKGKNNNTNKFSIIDLGKCGNILKDYYKINQNTSLILIKYEKVTNISSERSIQYEIYEPYNKTKLNLSICEDINIDIYVPITLSEKTQNLYNELKELGYDLFDINGPFYNDICTPYKSSNGTDVLLSDRVNTYYNQDDASCQSNCKYSDYLIESQYLKCECDIENSVINIKNAESFNAKSIYQSFYNVLKYSNYKVLKCYKLIMTMNTFTKNLGSIISLSYFFIYFLFLIIYSIRGIKQLSIEFSKILKKANKNNDKNNDKNNIKEKKITNMNKNKKIINIAEVFRMNFPKSSLIFLPKNKNKQINRKIIPLSQKQSEGINIYNSSRNNNPNSVSQLKLMNKNKQINLPQSKKIEFEFDNNELNNLEFNIAKKFDKRNCLQIYWSLLKREHSVIFTFIARDDHNITFVKYSRFFFLLCSDMAMNVFFFADETMHKMFIDYGKYNFIQQIPQIVYSTAVSKIIEIILCYLSLSDNHYYQAKELKNKSKYHLMRIMGSIKVKIGLFFAFTFLMFIFYWYLITCFCAVYQSTQIAFIKDSLSSFVLGILLPFGIYLIPSLLRIIALRVKKYNLACVYKLSNIIPFF